LRNKPPPPVRPQCFLFSAHPLVWHWFVIASTASFTVFPLFLLCSAALPRLFPGPPTNCKDNSPLFCHRTKKLSPSSPHRTSPTLPPFELFSKRFKTVRKLLLLLPLSSPPSSKSIRVHFSHHCPITFHSPGSSSFFAGRLVSPYGPFPICSSRRFFAFQGVPLVTPPPFSYLIHWPPLLTCAVICFFGTLIGRMGWPA